MENVFVSICIPSFNRPKELVRLLSSIDLKCTGNLEIVICEDNAPLRDKVRQAVNEFSLARPDLSIKYYENHNNLGYDKNLRELINKATGEYIIFMGDDDEFIPGCLEHYIDFLKSNSNLAYVLRSYRIIHDDRKIEYFKYYPETKFFSSGIDTYIELFRKSVFISGFTFKRKAAIPFHTDWFDGTLLYQLYLLSELCINFSSSYYGIPITQMRDEGIPYFGTSENEKDLYTPGSITIINSINFMKGFTKISRYIDGKYGTDSTSDILIDISKYSYPILAIQRNKGAKSFKYYCSELKKLGINRTIHYKLYVIGLTIFGTSFCNLLIRFIKSVLGKTPKL